MTTAPAFVRASNPLSRRLLRLGTPMGPNVLLTVRGRTSGLPRSAAVAVVELDGRRWVIGAYGDVQWVRNLRAAGSAEIRVHGTNEPVVARELDSDRGDRLLRPDPARHTSVACHGSGGSSPGPVLGRGAGGPQRPRARGVRDLCSKPPVEGRLA